MPVDRLMDPEVIGKQLERILASPAFRSSKRSSLLLRFIVERTLEGQTDLLKERTLGIEVFGRSSGYDTGSDHIVRSTAGEIRKRLAQYYLQAEFDFEPRIELLPGSYIPQFRVQERKAADVDLPLQLETPPRALLLPRRSGRHRVERVAVMVAGLVFAGWVWGHFANGQNAVRRFWSPLLESRVPIAICRRAIQKGSWEGIGSERVSHISVGWSSDSPGRRRLSREILVRSDGTFWVTRSRPLSLFALIGEKTTDQRFVYGPDSTLFRPERELPRCSSGGIDNFWTMSLTREVALPFSVGFPNEHHLH